MRRRQRGAERRRSPPQGRAPHLNAHLFQALRIRWVPAGLTSDAPKSLGLPSHPTRPPGPRRRKVRLTPVPPDGKKPASRSPCSLRLPPASPLALAAAGGAACGGPFSGECQICFEHSIGGCRRGLLQPLRNHLGHLTPDAPAWARPRVTPAPSPTAKKPGRAVSSSLDRASRAE